MSKISFSELKKELGITDVISYPVTSANSVYLLLQGDEVVYVGISDYFGVYARLKSHKCDKVFNEYTIMQTDLDRYNLELLEKGIISLLRPKFNTTHNRFKPEAHQYALQYLRLNPRFLSHDLFVVEKVVEKTIEKILEVEKIVEIKTPELPPIIKTVEKIIEVPVEKIVEIEIDKYATMESCFAFRCFLGEMTPKLDTRYLTVILVASSFLLAFIDFEALLFAFIFLSFLSVGIVSLYPEFDKDREQTLLVYKTISLLFSIVVIVILFFTLTFNMIHQ